MADTGEVLPLRRPGSPPAPERETVPGAGRDFEVTRIQVAQRLGLPPDQRRANFDKLLQEAHRDPDARHDPGWAGTPLPEGTLPTYDLTDEQFHRFRGWLRYSSGAKVYTATPDGAHVGEHLRLQHQMEQELLTLIDCLEGGAGQ